MQNTMKFAVSRVVGDEETILKLFEGNQKDAAVSCAKQAAKEYPTGLIVLFQAAFTPEGSRADERMRMYEAYRCGKGL